MLHLLPDRWLRCLPKYLPKVLSERWRQWADWYVGGLADAVQWQVATLTRELEELVIEAKARGEKIVMVGKLEGTYCGTPGP